MCRFLAYLGREAPLADLLTRPPHSLVAQSRSSREQKQPVNGDGFGVGWYAPGGIDPEPCTFHSARAAWNDRNLRRLAGKLPARLAFAHVRAASLGSTVGEENCHPFAQGRFLFMHDGELAGFGRFKQRLIAELDPATYAAVEGTSDSEHAFALFLDELGGGAASPAEPGRMSFPRRSGRVVKVDLFRLGDA